MDEIISVLFPVVSSVLLAKYYGAFLTAKSGKIGFKLLIAGFGLTYFLLYYASTYITGRFFEDYTMQYQLVRLVIRAGCVFAVSFLFFKKRIGTQIFLLCSFFAIEEIIRFAAMSFAELISTASGFVIASILPVISAATQEIWLRYFDIIKVIILTVQIISYTLIFALTLASIIRNFLHKKYTLRLTELLLLILPCFTGLSLACIIKSIILKPGGNGALLYSEVPFVWVWTLISCALLLLSIIAGVKLFQKFIEQNIEEKSAAVLQKQVENMQEQAHNIGDIYSELRGMRHDMKSHLSSVGFLAKAVAEDKADAEELDKYLGSIGKTLDKFELLYQTGSAISDIVIHQKHMDAVSRGIDFSANFIFPERMNLDAYDLAVILSNALENAIEANEAVPQPDRFVRLYSYVKGGHFLIEIENNFTGCIVLDKNTGLPVSGKADKDAHGMGLSNIRRCARKYFGDIDFRITEGKSAKIFRLTVMLQGRD